MHCNPATMAMAFNTECIRATKFSCSQEMMALSSHQALPNLNMFI